MKDKIITGINDLATDQGIKILLAVESGSRAWGFASPDSDWDVKFVYSRPLSWYLSVHERRDVIESPITEDLLDYSGWDVRKMLYQIHRGNPALFEWFNSPITYYVDTSFLSAAKNLMGKYFNPRAAIYHYLHMASGNYRSYLKSDLVRLKKYFYVLRPLLACRWIERHHTMPPTEFEALLVDEKLDSKSTFPFAAVDDLLHKKKETKELGESLRIDIINRWLETKIEYFSDLARTASKVTSRPDDLDEYFYQLVRGSNK